jgi:L-galactose dehydrogenase
MKYRNLGETDLTVSILGFGASPLGEEFGKIDPLEGQRAVDAAIDHGINYFDVSPYYGRTLAEERLGEYLQGKRDQVILATKAGRYDAEPPEGFDFSAARITQSVEESLKRLRTDVIDVFQAHDIEFVDKRQIIDEAIPAMQQLKSQGKVRYIGITGYPLKVLKEVASDTEIDTILSYCHYNLMNTTLESYLEEFAKRQGIGLINASPLHMRILTEKGAPDWHPAPESVRKAGERAAVFCKSRGINISHLAMQFALGYDGVATTLVGMSKQSHVERNVAALDEDIDQDLLEEVLQLFKPVMDLNWLVGKPENNESDALKV